MSIKNKNPWGNVLNSNFYLFFVEINLHLQTIVETIGVEIVLIFFLLKKYSKFGSIETNRSKIDLKIDRAT
jgi:hypothetical protein